MKNHNVYLKSSLLLICWGLSCVSVQIWLAIVVQISYLFTKKSEVWFLMLPIKIDVRLKKSLNESERCFGAYLSVSIMDGNLYIFSARRVICGDFDAASLGIILKHSLFNYCILPTSPSSYLVNQFLPFISLRNQPIEYNEHNGSLSSSQIKFYFQKMQFFEINYFLN